MFWLCIHQLTMCRHFQQDLTTICLPSIPWITQRKSNRTISANTSCKQVDQGATWSRYCSAQTGEVPFYLKHSFVLTGQEHCKGVAGVGEMSVFAHSVQLVIWDPLLLPFLQKLLGFRKGKAAFQRGRGLGTVSQAGNALGVLEGEAVAAE